MPVLQHHRHETIAQELAAGKTPEQASEIAGYDVSASSFASNARKRACRNDVRDRVAEIRQPAADRAGLSLEYMLARLRNPGEYNVHDYLTPPDKDGRRFFDIGRVSPAVLGRLSELQLDQSSRGRGTAEHKIVKTKIKGYDLIAVFTLGARLQGLLSPDKVELTTTGFEGIDDPDELRSALNKRAEELGIRALAPPPKNRNQRSRQSG